MSKPKISAEVSTEEMEAYTSEAKRFGYSLSEWMRRTLNSACPETPRQAAVDAAFNKLDEPNAQSGMTALLMGPESQRPVPPVVAKPLDKMPAAPQQRVGVGHPCMYLNPALPGVLRGGEAQGTCNHGNQRGKPCFWPPQSCQRSCPLFAMRLDLRARPAAAANRVDSRR